MQKMTMAQARAYPAFKIVPPPADGSTFPNYGTYHEGPDSSPDPSKVRSHPQQMVGASKSTTRQPT